MKRPLSPERIKQFRNLKKLLVKKDPDRALLYASRCFFTAEETVAAMNQSIAPDAADTVEIEDGSAPAPVVMDFVESVPVIPDATAVASASKEAQISTEMRDGWPVESEAKIWQECPNPHYMVIKLMPSGHLVSMMRDVRKWRINATILVRLVKTEGEVCYQAIKFLRH